MGPSQVLAGRIAFVINALLAVVALAFALVILVFWSKARRDRAERRSAVYRAALAEALEHEDADALGELLRPLSGRSSIERQTDLLAVLTTTRAAAWWTDRTTAFLADGLAPLGFADRLQRQVGSRSAAQRGTAVLIGAHPSCRLPVPVTAGLMQDADATVRLAAASALEQEQSAAAADALVDALVGRVLPDPRLVERLRHDWAVPTCRARLRSLDTADSGSARGALARALGLAGDPAAIPELLWLLDVGDAEETFQAMRALDGCAPSAPPEQRVLVAQAARAQLDAADPVMVAIAIDALSATGDADDIPRLAAFVAHADWHIRRAAARALLEFGTAGIDAVRAIATSPDRYAAERAREELQMLRLFGEDDPDATTEVLHGV